MKQNNQMASAGQEAKRAYVYSGFWSTNNYIQCYDGGIKAHSHYPQWHSNRQERNAPVTQHLCNGGAA